MSCPRCNSDKIVLAGKYNNPNSFVKQRFRCKRCNYYFIIRTKSYKLKLYGYRIRKKIIKLYKTKKLYRNPFDNSKKNTYSIREIAKMLNISKSFVHNVIKNGKI